MSTGVWAGDRIIWAAETIKATGPAAAGRLAQWAKENRNATLYRVGGLTGAPEWPGWMVTGGQRDEPAATGPWLWTAINGRLRFEVVDLQVALAGGVNVGPWDAFEPGDLVTAFTAWEKLTGEPWARSVGQTAENLILSTHTGPRATRLDRSPRTPEPMRTSNLETPWHDWTNTRGLADAIAGGGGPAGWYVHAYDGNAQYLAAWIVAELGTGSVSHETAPLFDPAVAGIWSLPAPTRPDGDHAGADLPLPWSERHEWFTTPTVTRMLEMCDLWGVPHPEIFEAHLWAGRSRYLRAAGEKLRDTRAAAHAQVARATGELRAAKDVPVAEAILGRVVAAEAVGEAVAAVYRVQTGRLGMDGQTGAWCRPDWAHTIRATARVNLHRRLCKLTAAPFAIATDGLLFLTREPDGAAYAERIGLPLGDGLGQFSHDATALLDRLPAGFLDGRAATMFAQAGTEHAGVPA